MFDCFVRIREEEGETALVTQGLWPTVLQRILTELVSSVSTKYIAHPILRKVASQHAWMLALPLATIANELWTHPVSTISKRMQVQSQTLPKSMRPRITGNSIGEVVSRTRNEQGSYRALWSGFSGVILRSIAVSATMGAALLVDDLAVILRENYGGSYAMLGI